MENNMDIIYQTKTGDRFKNIDEAILQEKIYDCIGTKLLKIKIDGEINRPSSKEWMVFLKDKKNRKTLKRMIHEIDNHKVIDKYTGKQ